jgi:hypothetical protein
MEIMEILEIQENMDILEIQENMDILEIQDIIGGKDKDIICINRLFL